MSYNSPISYKWFLFKFHFLAKFTKPMTRTGRGDAVQLPNALASAGECALVLRSAFPFQRDNPRGRSVRFSEGHRSTWLSQRVT